MDIPSAVLASGWIPFVVILLLVILFSTIYVKYFMSKYDGTISTTAAGIIALSVTLLTTALIPVDVFLVSSMKDSDGNFKSWANGSDKITLENSIQYAYYTLYGLVTFCLFLMLPFVYFFYEEQDEETNNKARCCTSLKYSAVFLFIVTVLLLLGAFLPTAKPPNKNATQIEKIEELLSNLSTNNGEDALSFVISAISLIGMCSLITYTAYGMSAFPMSLIKGSKSAKSEKMTVRDQRDSKRQRINAIRQKYQSRGLSARSQGEIADLEEEDHLLERKEKHLGARESSFIHKCLRFLRPFEVVFGVFFFLVTLLIFVSLLLTNIDKAMHSLGYKLGYALPSRKLPNPVDILLVVCQKAFPVDYVLFALLVVYLFVCSLSGVRNIGIWFFWIRMYKIRPRRTRPQGILMLCMVLMFTLLAMNIIVYELTPQYSAFGGQKYVIHPNSSAGSHIEDKTKVASCTLDVVSTNDCVPSRMSLLLTKFFYRMWFFGAAYYWTTWVFLGIILIGFVIALCKKKKSSIDGEVDEDDFDESDDDLIRA